MANVENPYTTTLGNNNLVVTSKIKNAVTISSILKPITEELSSYSRLVLYDNTTVNFSEDFKYYSSISDSNFPDIVSGYVYKDCLLIPEQYFNTEDYTFEGHGIFTSLQYDSVYLNTAIFMGTITDGLSGNGSAGTLSYNNSNRTGYAYRRGNNSSAVEFYGVQFNNQTGITYFRFEIPLIVRRLSFEILN